MSDPSERTDHAAAAPERGTAGPPWFTRGVAGIGSAGLLTYLGHEVPTALLPSLVTLTLGAPTAALHLIEGVRAVLNYADIRTLHILPVMPRPQPASSRRVGSARGVNRYTEACLLLLLAEHPGHGYELAERLVEIFPVPDLAPDLSSIYRIIAELEDQGAIRSRWTAGAGGGKKTCELTDDGWQLLRFWEERFHAEQEGLARFFERFRVADRDRQQPR